MWRRNFLTNLKMADSFLETELSDLERTLRLLAENGSVSLSSLNDHPHLNSAIESVRLAVSLLYDTNSYSLIRQMLDRLPQPSVIAPDTINSFLFGCDKVANRPNGFCSPYCIDSVLPPKSSRPIMCCPHRIYLLNHHGLRRLNDVKSSTSQVYTTFRVTGLTPEQIATLRADGVTSAEILLLGSTTPSFTTIVPMKSLTDYQNNPSSSVTRQTPTTTSSSSNTWIWLLLILLVVIIVVLAVIFWPR